MPPVAAHKAVSAPKSALRALDFWWISFNVLLTRSAADSGMTRAM
jgi:hypothetical protein